MKKHLTLPAPSFHSLGVQVPPQVEGVVRHALEKEPAARTPSIEVFLRELREAVTAVPASARPTRKTGALDPNQTVVTAVTSDTTPKMDTAEMSEPPFESMSGTVSSTGVEAQQLEAARLEKEQREKIAREELAREAEAQRKQEEAAVRKRKEEEERLRKEHEEREAREREQQAQIERVARQAKELEDRLARLATSMPPPQVAVIDPETTQVHQAVTTQDMGNNSFPGVELPMPGTKPGIARPGIGRHMPAIAVGVVLVVLLIGGLGTGAYFLWPDSGPTPTPTPTPTPPPDRGGVKPDLVEITGGTFEMGRNDGPPQERPQHTVSVSTFYMDRTEVTNEEYAEFVRDMRVEPPSHWLRGKPLPLQEKWPVVNVSPRDAEAFAAWRSKRDGVTYRLPTEEEWEYAARSGGAYKLYPWGDKWEDGKAVVKEADAKPVGSLPAGANQWGVVDLIGNVWEWTSSRASLYPGSRLGEIPGATKDWVVIRGGSYSSDPQDRQIPISATYRDWFDPGIRQPNYGFRLVRSP